MKLYQYRFAKIDAPISRIVAIKIARFLGEKNEHKFMDIVSRPNGGLSAATVSNGELDQYLEILFLDSFNASRKFGGSMKSAISCRFVIFEDDGLVRICYSSDDAILNFDECQVPAEEISQLLIDTDLFDFSDL